MHTLVLSWHISFTGRDAAHVSGFGLGQSQLESAGANAAEVSRRPIRVAVVPGQKSVFHLRKEFPHRAKSPVNCGC